MGDALVTVPFHGDDLLIIETPDGVYVAIKPICERLGIARQPQQRKLSSDAERWGWHLMVLPSGGGEQEIGCIPLTRLAAWLFTISANRVKPEVRDALIAYQNEAADVLDRHFRLREREREAEIAALRLQNRRLGAMALAFKPAWARIKALSEGGIYRDAVRYFLNLSQQQAWDHLQQMEELGLIDPRSWRTGVDEPEETALPAGGADAEG